LLLDRGEHNPANKAQHCSRSACRPSPRWLPPTSHSRSPH